MDNKVYAIQLLELRNFARKQGVPPHYIAIKLKDKEHSGVVIDISNIEDAELPPEEMPLTLFKLDEMAFLHFANENEEDLFAVFGRVADGMVPKIVAHIELRRHLAQNALDHIVIRQCE